MRPEPPAEDATGCGHSLRTGTDLVDVADLGRRLAQQPGLAERVFTYAELKYCRSRRRRCDEHLAARFAAKEAVLKALGTGLSHGVEWTEVEIPKELGGRPRVVLHGSARRIALGLRVREVDVSLSHAAGLAIANAVLMTGGSESHEALSASPT